MQDTGRKRSYTHVLSGVKLLPIKEIMVALFKCGYKTKYTRFSVINYRINHLKNIISADKLVLDLKRECRI